MQVCCCSIIAQEKRDVADKRAIGCCDHKQTERARTGKGYVPLGGRVVKNGVGMYGESPVGLAQSAIADPRPCWQSAHILRAG